MSQASTPVSYHVNTHTVLHVLLIIMLQHVNQFILLDFSACETLGKINIYAL